MSNHQKTEIMYFNNFSYFFLSRGLNVNIFYLKYLTHDSTKEKNNMHFL